MADKDGNCESCPNRYNSKGPRWVRVAAGVVVACLTAIVVCVTVAICIALLSL